MEQMNGNELRSVLIEKNLIDDAGAVNALKANLISGAHTWPLLSEVWNLYQNDVTSMEELQVFLNAVYEQGQYDILINILKILYNCCWLPIPNDLQMIFDCEEKELKEVYSVPSSHVSCCGIIVPSVGQRYIAMPSAHRLSFIPLFEDGRQLIEYEKKYGGIKRKYAVSQAQAVGVME